MTGCGHESLSESDTPWQCHSDCPSHCGAGQPPEARGRGRGDGGRPVTQPPGTWLRLEEGGGSGREVASLGPRSPPTPRVPDPYIEALYY